jgi:glucose-6-phosphate 1-dehydrogenase
MQLVGLMLLGFVRRYRQEERVSPTSGTETFATVKFLIDNWRWQGVPFYLRTGKRMPHRVTEIAVQFKRPPYLLFRETSLPGDRVPPNELSRVQPDEGIFLRFEAKQPGQAIRLQPVEMEFKYGGTLNELPFSAYETLLLDCMEGDSTLFNRADHVEEAWRVVTPILNAWKTVPRRGVMVYEAGSWGEAADTLLAGRRAAAAIDLSLQRISVRSRRSPAVRASAGRCRSVGPQAPTNSVAIPTAVRVASDRSAVRRRGR